MIKRCPSRKGEVTMQWEPIHKTPSKQAVVPNLWDYEEVRSSFTWDAARNEFDGLPGRGRVRQA